MAKSVVDTARFVYESDPIPLTRFGPKYNGIVVILDVDTVMSLGRRGFRRLLKPLQGPREAVAKRREELLAQGTKDDPEDPDSNVTLTTEQLEQLDAIEDEAAELELEGVRIICAHVVARVEAHADTSAELPEPGNPDSWGRFSPTVCRWINTAGIAEVQGKYLELFRGPEPTADAPVGNGAEVS
jgi:hypothetical protein